MLQNLIIKILEMGTNIGEGLFWLGVIIILVSVIAMLFVIGAVAIWAIFLV